MVISAFFAEWLLLRQAPAYAQARQIQLCDRWYGIFAGAVLVVGFLRVYFFEKGKAFYDGNPFPGSRSHRPAGNGHVRCADEQRGA